MARGGAPRGRPLLGCLQLGCRRLASSSAFSAVTTVLTLYALFGDDMRLLCTEKPSDAIFDGVTIFCMAVFGLEMLACSLGKAGYFLGFFFWLDLLSTVTLLLDITPVAEQLLGDSISSADSRTSTGGRSAGGDSAEAARAARMSRAGTKAGRVVRLVRLVRLLRFMKLYRKDAYPGGEHPHPGFNWEDEDDDGQNLEKESAVSKKLSEMTTRRVIMLVLLIMLALPFFQPSMYTEKLPSSAQYGINVLYRRWISDMMSFLPASGPLQGQAYLQSKERKVYTDDFHMYVYYHNPFCESSEVPAGTLASPLSSFGKLFWLGAGPPEAASTEYFLPRSGDGAPDLNSRWSGRGWHYYMGNLTAEPARLLHADWRESEPCVANTARGISLIKDRDPGVVCPEDLRYQERAVVYPNLMTSAEWETAFFMFVFDRRRGSQMEALLNTAQTIFICFLLGFGAMTFSNDANKLVLAPIERMISKLDIIRNNPLEAMTIGDEEHRREQVAEAAASRRKRGAGAAGEGGLRPRALLDALRELPGRLARRAHAAREQPEPMETVVLEKTIVKIGSLLALGFGEAGAEIIGQNLRGGDSSALNAMIPGRRVEAIFGFCDIRNFTDATEVLQDQVMVFVNRIAGVVHSCIHEFFGSPNKNIGDAFMLAWRLSEHDARKQQRLADMALISFIKIIAQINKSPMLAEYRNHPKLVKRLPNYRVRMGFGLHSGWAIEGAIGSEFKIDASYLSPNVNMASRLEAVTKQFGCLILISDSLHQLMSERIAEECRLIDHVKVVGGKEAFKLYTIDLDDLALEVDRATPVAHSKQAKFKQRYEVQQRKNERWSEDFDMHSLFAQDPDIQTMRNKFSLEFFCRFNMAYLNYEAGEWAVAKDMLEATRFLLVTEDGPSAALLRFMKQFNWEAPKAWPGYRVLADT